jgi:hypothetical protein
MQATVSLMKRLYDAIRVPEQVGVLTWMNRIKRVRECVPRPACSATRCNDVARSRVAPAALRRRVALARLAGKGDKYGQGQIRPREPRRPQPDATALRGSARFAMRTGLTAQPPILTSHRIRHPAPGGGPARSAATSSRTTVSDRFRYLLRGRADKGEAGFGILHLA